MSARVEKADVLGWNKSTEEFSTILYREGGGRTRMGTGDVRKPTGRLGSAGCGRGMTTKILFR